MIPSNDNCADPLEIGILTNCMLPLKPGVEQQLLLMNVDDIVTLVFSDSGATDLITNLDYQGPAIFIPGVKSNINYECEYVEPEDANPGFRQRINYVISHFNDNERRFVKNLLTRPKFMAVLGRKDKGPNDRSEFILFGRRHGLVVENVIDNSTENQNQVIVTMSTEEGLLESEPPVVMRTDSQAEDNKIEFLNAYDPRLLLRWRFDGNVNPTFKDACSSGVHCGVWDTNPLAQPPEWFFEPSANGQSIVLPTDQGLRLNGTAPYEFGTDASFTMFIRAKADENDAQYGLMGQLGGNSAVNDYCGIDTEQGDVRAGFWDGNTLDASLVVCGSIQDEFKTFAFRYNHLTNTMTGFNDGAEENEDVGPSGTINIGDFTHWTVKGGGLGLNPANTDTVRLGIDEMRLYNVALTNEEIQQIADVMNQSIS